MVVAAERSVMEQFAWSEATPGVSVLGRGFIFHGWDVAARWPCCHPVPRVCPFPPTRPGQLTAGIQRGLNLAHFPDTSAV